MNGKTAGLAGSREQDLYGKQPTEDLHREAVNMLALKTRQSKAVISLSRSSKTAQAVLRQF